MGGIEVLCSDLAGVGSWEQWEGCPTGYTWEGRSRGSVGKQAGERWSMETHPRGLSQLTIIVWFPKLGIHNVKVFNLGALTDSVKVWYLEQNTGLFSHSASVGQSQEPLWNRTHTSQVYDYIFCHTPACPLCLGLWPDLRHITSLSGEAAFPDALLPDS